jgi:hypothetical protein
VRKSLRHVIPTKDTEDLHKRNTERKNKEKEEIKPYQYWDGKSWSRSRPVRKPQKPNKAERNRGSS